LNQDKNERGFWSRVFFRDPPDPAPQSSKSAYSEGGTVDIDSGDEDYSYWRNAGSHARILLSIANGGAATQAEVTSFPCVLGRLADSATLVLPDTSVSRQHALIEHIGGGYYITDTNSSNGVIVNDVKLGNGERRQINSGDIIYIGRVKLHVRAMK
jgi:hypothetical protein